MIIKYSRHGCSVYINAQKYICDIIDLKIGSFFSKELCFSIPVGVWIISIGKKMPDYPKSEFERIRLEQVQEPDIDIYLDRLKKTIFISTEFNKDWVIQNAIRLVRVLLRLQCQAIGDVFLHGGLVNCEGIGICYLGDKKSGKTTSVLSLMKYYRADFISNDDVSLHLTEEGIWVGEGWPRAIVVRQDVWNKLGFDSSFFAHPLNTEIQANVCLYPRELSEGYQCKLLHQSKINYFVFPEFVCGKAYIEEMDSQDAINKILQYILVNPGKYNEFLLPMFEVQNVDTRKALVDYLKNVRCFKLYQNFEQLAEGGELLYKFLKSKK